LRPGIAVLVLSAALMAACATPSDRSGPADPLPSMILSPQQGAAQSCPIGGIPGPVVPAERVEAVLEEHVPHYLPPGQFGLAAAWGPVGGSATAGAAWSDPRCRTVRIVLDPNGSVGSGPQVGDWTLTRSEQCGSGLLVGAPCLEYRTDVAEGTLILSAVGLAREEGDAVATSVPL
jgi:hypothetical protein